MRQWEINVRPSTYQEIVSGIRTFFTGERERYLPGDRIVLYEFGACRSGRKTVCEITHVYTGKDVSSDKCILSFQIVLPEDEPRIPVKVFMELHKLLRDAQSRVRIY